MKRFMNKAVIPLICSLLLMGCTGMDKDPSKEFITANSYYNDANRHITLNRDVGGFNNLTLDEKSDSITLENQKVRIVLHKNGAIKEYVNKESKLYLTKDTPQIDPIRIDLVNQNGVTSNSYSYQITSNSPEKIQIKYLYDFGASGQAETFISLAKDSDEVIFNVSLLNTSYKGDQSVLDVEYPIIENIKTLNGKEKDVFATPYATGYLFKNPIDNFNGDYGIGLGKSMATYPSGWYYTMQFATYYSENLGGFYWTARDAKDYIKAFSFIGGGDEDLRMSLFHFVDDLSDTETRFGYDFVIANMNEGRWQEAANRYKEWAINQPWIKSIGETKDRNDINKTLYEKTGLSYFGLRSDVATWVDMIPTYDQIASRLDNSVLNIAIYLNKNYFDIVREYNHQYSVFEFNSISSLPQFNTNAIQYKNHSDSHFDVHGTPFYYQCPYSEDWLENRNMTEQGYFNTYNVDALYFDVAFTAIHPIQCFNSGHTHGTRINILPGFYHQLDNADKLASRNGFFSVGTEMLTERILPYIDFYQARANGGPLGWMESDEIRGMVEDNVAIKIPLFDYVYHEYGGVRMDGYLVPLDELGNSYYYIAAYTALNGGIVEFNYEYFPIDTLPSANRINVEMVDFVNRLGNMRTTYGKDYLVYGHMKDTPSINSGLVTYEYFQPNYTSLNSASTGRTILTGEWEMNKVVTAAYENEKGNVAIFFSNITEKTIDECFVLQALRDYGISSADVYLRSSVNPTSRKVTSVKNGTAKIGLRMQPHQIYMLEIIK